MHLLVGIDTEGDNQWDAAARANQRFENIYALPRLHALFARHGVRPTYVITHPVASDPRSADVLRELKAGGDCEIGAHHHAWETPPCTAEDVRRHPYASNLPLGQFEDQLASLTDAIERAVGERPVSYRSGPVRLFRRARAGARTARLPDRIERRAALLRGAQDGPDFVEAPLRPYFLSYDSATKPGTSGVLEVPVSAALNRALPKRLQYLYARAPRNYTTKRVLRKLGVARMRWLRPSYSSLEDMIGLARDLARAGEPVLNLLFHSSEAIVGGSPYNKTDAELAAFCDRLERFFEYAIGRLGASPVTFSEFDEATYPASAFDTPGLPRPDENRPHHAAPAAGPGGECAAAVPARRMGDGARRFRPLHRPSSGDGHGRSASRRHLDPAHEAIALAADAAPGIDRRRVAHQAGGGRHHQGGGRRPRPQQRPAAGDRRADRPSAGKAGRADAVWHRDLALPPEAARARPLHACLHRCGRGHVLQPAAARAGRGARSETPSLLRRLSAGRLVVPVPRSRGPAGRAARARHHGREPARQRQAPPPARRPALPARGDAGRGARTSGHPPGDLRHRRAASGAPGCGTIRGGGTARDVRRPASTTPSWPATARRRTSSSCRRCSRRCRPSPSRRSRAARPVISSDNPGGVELHGVFGDDVAVVPKEQPAALAAAIVAALRQKRRTIRPRRRSWSSGSAPMRWRGSISISTRK